MNNPDFALAWEGASGPSGPWGQLRVVEFRGTEGISTPYHYEITTHVRSPAPEVDPDELVGSRATLRMTTHTEPSHRLVHGIITEAEELGTTSDGTLHRVVLSPPLARAMHRSRCRIFLEKTTRQILEAVLRGDSGFTPGADITAEPDSGALDFVPARELYAFRISSATRLDQVTARPYCVQYNESDFAFLSRLLEEEGIGYHFEHGDGVCLLVLSDQDTGRTRLDPFSPLGPSVKGREVISMKLGARLRARKVSLQDYDWKKPALAMAVEQSAGGGDLVEHEYPGRYLETPDLGKPLAMARLERLGFEASYAVGDGACRLLSAGAIFALESMSERHDGEYLVTRLQVRGQQHGELPPSAHMMDTSAGVPYTSTFECARRGKKGTESRFRPARSTPKPRILGVQTAFVTAEPATKGKEIHIGGPPGGEIGCVRVKFHWYQESARQAKEPTSCWVRVSQVFAGAGQGAVWHPRVGVEVLVELEEGDPDRPIVVGRVYNGQNQPPTVVPEVSTLKSMTSPGDGTFNEFTFDDTAGKQQIKLHTPRDWNSEVGHDRTETVTTDSTSSVGVNRSESTGAERSTMVGANNTELVAGNETMTVGGNQTLGVSGDQDVSVTGDQGTTVKGSQTVDVTVDQAVGIKGNQSVNVTGDRTITVQANQVTMITQSDALVVDGEQVLTVVKAQNTSYRADHSLFVGGLQTIVAAKDQLIATNTNQTVQATEEQKLFARKQILAAQETQALSSNTLTLNAVKSAQLASRTVHILASQGTPEVEAGLAAAAGAAPLPPLVNIHSSDEVTIGGKKLNISFSEEIVIECKSIKLLGSKIEINGGQEVEVQAAIIKLN